MILSYIVPIVLLAMILAMFWIMPTLVPYNLPFGVRIPPQRQQEPALARVRRTYYGGLLLIALITTLGIGILLQRFPAYWILFGSSIVELVLCMLNYLLSHYTLLRAKERGLWYAGLHQAVVADTQASLPQRLPWLWLIIAWLPLLAIIIISIIRYPALPQSIPTHFGINGEPNQWTNKASAVWLLPVTGLVISAMLTLLARYVPIAGRTLDPADIEGSRQRKQLLAQNWIRLIPLLEGGINLTFLLVSLMTLQVLPTNGATSGAISTLAIVPSIVVVIALSVAISKTRRQPQTSTNRMSYVLRDDDRYWIAGMFYVNKDDPSIFVEKRFGIGQTINFGNPMGILVMALLIGIPLAVAILSKAFAYKH
jgi:uncharacterized membrane protein